MTLQNGLIHRDRAFLWSDEGHFDAATGELVLLQSKAIQCQWPPFAVSASSNGGNPHDIFSAIGEAAPSDLSALLSACADALRAYAAQGYLANLLIAAWDNEPRLFFASTHEAHGEPAFIPFEVLHHVSTGQHLPAYHAAVAEGLTPRSMARLIDAQIASPFALEGPLSASGERTWYGGGVVQIEVSRTGVTERFIRMVETLEAA
ncbi:MAG: hypothetical protein JNN10_09205 [Sphingopyxis sp.]|uniref:hypothetical protein n=1 Tax=Sphingopyxis sp. TaxID=1908224 RepID=UPI001A492BC4|nr:hypothetical protein [Sphingopyxis sp.]MBL9066456.1 hypothetical protein [Sphingopyxis sp.]